MSQENFQLIQRAAALHDLGRTPEAIEILRTVTASDPEDTRALVMLSECLIDISPEDARLTALAALSISPDDVECLLAAAWTSDRVGGSSADAQKYARAAVAGAPHSARAYQMLSMILSSNVDTSLDGLQAEDAARRAVELAPHDTHSWLAMGNAQAARGRSDDARAAYLKALEIDPEFAVVKQNLAHMDQHDGQIGSALELIQSVIVLDPSDGDARKQLDDIVIDFLGHLMWVTAIFGGILGAIIVNVFRVG